MGTAHQTPKSMGRIASNSTVAAHGLCHPPCISLWGLGCMCPMQSRQQPGAQARFLHHSCRWGLQGGGGGLGLQQRFLSEPVSQCAVFGRGTQLTVLGESPIAPPSLLSQLFGKFYALSSLFLRFVPGSSQASPQIPATGTLSSSCPSSYFLTCLHWLLSDLQL